MTSDRRRDANPRARAASELETLRTRLRRGDPAADGCAPSDDEIRALRERVIRAAAADKAPRPTRPLWSRRPAVAAALLILALGTALVVGLGDRRLEPERQRSTGTTGPDSTTRQVPGGATARSATGARQIHFTAPGGTRIVWVLYREPEPYPSAGDSGGADERRGAT